MFVTSRDHAPVDAGGTVVSQAVRCDGGRLSLLVEVDAQSPAWCVLVLNSAYLHTRSRLHSTTFHHTHSPPLQSCYNNNMCNCGFPQAYNSDNISQYFSYWYFKLTCSFVQCKDNNNHHISVMFPWAELNKKWTGRIPIPILPSFMSPKGVIESLVLINTKC